MKQKMLIVDGNNWFRRRAESNLHGTPVRSAFNEIRYKDGIVIVVWDGYGGKAARQAFYPEYKAGRVHAGESFYESQKLLKKLLSFTQATQVEVGGFEGDDVIGALVNRYKDSCNIFIESNDLDMYQLGVPMARDNFPDAPHRITLMKTMVGDPSDNIKGAKGFGKGAWEKLTDHQKDTLHQIVCSGWGLTEQEIRDKCVDFYPKSALNWFVDPENRKTLAMYYKIVNFLPIDWTLIESNMKPGLNKPELAEPIMQEFYL